MCFVFACEFFVLQTGRCRMTPCLLLESAGGQGSNEEGLGGVLGGTLGGLGAAGAGALAGGAGVGGVAPLEAFSSQTPHHRHH